MPFKEEILEAVWPGTTVTDTVLKVCIREIREALGDDPSRPRFVETAHRRGYRFVAPVEQPRIEREIIGAYSARHLVGCEAEMARMRGWLEEALAGHRQTVFVTGEPGIGKTSLVEALLAAASGHTGVLTGRGRCLEHYGSSEAYMPVFDALSRMCRGPGGGAVVKVLALHAPTWLAQMPGLVDAREREGLQRELLGATRERMLREVAEAIEALTLYGPLVVALEDLHWSDYSTYPTSPDAARAGRLSNTPVRQSSLLQLKALLSG